MSKKNKADLSLILVTAGWGASFILSKQALTELSVFNFLAYRFLVAFIICLVIFIKPMRKMSKETLQYGIGLGLVLFLAFSIQTMGLAYTSVSNSAFITGLSVVMVPLLLSVIEKKLPQAKIVVGSLMAVGGLGLLTLTGSSLQLNVGDLLSVIGAFFFALHIIGVGRAPRAASAVPMAILQIGTVGVLSLMTSLIFENPTLQVGSITGMNLFVLALVCTAGAYIVQNVAQQYTTAARTALIYAMEPVFAAVCGFILLGETLSGVGIFGAALILLGTLVTELPMIEWLIEKIERKITLPLR